MMRNSKTKKINQILFDFLNQSKNNNQKDFMMIWRNVMGKHIVMETKQVLFERNILYVTIKNPYLKTDLECQKNNILEKIRKSQPNVKTIVFK